jgi:hypothetical protein
MKQVVDDGLGKAFLLLLLDTREPRADFVVDFPQNASWAIHERLLCHEPICVKPVSITAKPSINSVQISSVRLQKAFTNYLSV